jgi:hypothetical protein
MFRCHLDVTPFWAVSPIHANRKCLCITVHTSLGSHYVRRVVKRGRTVVRRKGKVLGAPPPCDMVIPVLGSYHGTYFITTYRMTENTD